MNIEALHQLRRVLKQVRDEKRPFEITGWSRATKDGGVPPPLTTPVNECGTASCAAGWAARDPWFIERGFVLEERKVWTDPVLYPRWKSFSGTLACTAFFDISEREFGWLFGAENANGAGRALTRLNKLLDGKSPT